MKTQNFESSCYRTGKYTVGRHFRAFFSREILQAVAVKGLKTTDNEMRSEITDLFRLSSVVFCPPLGRMLA